MGFHDRYYVNKTAEEEGTWVELGDGIAVKVRRFNSAHAKATRRKLEEPHAALMRSGTVPEDIADDILTKQMSQSLIIDWKGVTTETGEAIPATPENVEGQLRKYPEFRNEVAALVLDRQTFKKLIQKEDLKNS